jgi:hypothetical protein
MKFDRIVNQILQESTKDIPDITLLRQILSRTCPRSEPRYWYKVVFIFTDTTNKKGANNKKRIKVWHHPFLNEREQKDTELECKVLFGKRFIAVMNKRDQNPYAPGAPESICLYLYKDKNINTLDDINYINTVSSVINL